MTEDHSVRYLVLDDDEAAKSLVIKLCKTKYPGEFVFVSKEELEAWFRIMKVEVARIRKIEGE